MKICPECDRTYHDDQQNFCLMDGAVLIDGTTQPTVAIPSSAAETAVLSGRATRADEPKRGNASRVWIPVILTAIGLIFGAVVGGGALYVFLSRQDASAKYEKKTQDTPAKRPRPTQNKPTTAPVPSPTKVDDRHENNEGPPIDAVPVLWMTTGVPFEEDVSDYTTVFCPPDGSEYPIWGVDFYTTDSSVCTAAVHAGLITFESGGKVKLEFVSGRKTYSGSVRNGVTSQPYGEHDSSFIFPDR